MKILKTIFIVFVLCLTFSRNVTKAQAPIPDKPKTNKEILEDFTKKYGSDYKIVSRVIDCESGWKYVSGDGGASNGPAQFARETFYRYAKMLGKEMLYTSYNDQLELTAYVFSLGEINKEEWTTYRAIKRGGVYKFYSKRESRDITVYCKL